MLIHYQKEPAILERQDSVEEIQLKVDGITCCSSVKGVKKALNVLYGVEDVEVSMSTGKLVVKGEGEQFTRENLESALGAAGFSVKEMISKASERLTGKGHGDAA